MDNIKDIVKEGYSRIIKQSSGCGCSCKNKIAEDIAKSIGYSEEELNNPGNLGLGCGNPIAFSNLSEGHTVLDLGSGAGFDCFIASKKVGAQGKVIGVDFNLDMIKKARENANRGNYKNVEFREGDIEDLPVENNSVDIVISNCVINLAPDKYQVFKEAYRVLKKGGKMYVSDIVLLKNLEKEKKESPHLLIGCVAGAVLKEEYLSIITKAGFKFNILSEDKKISKEQYNGIPLESIKVECIKD